MPSFYFLILLYAAATAAAAAAKSLQSCPTLCDPIDGSPAGSSVHGIFPGKNTEVGCHFLLQCMKVKSESQVAQSCLTLCNPMGCSPPGSSVHGILQARTLEWGAISFSNAGKWKVKVKLLSRVRLLAIPWTAAQQAPPSMGFSRQEYWSGVPFPSPMQESEKWKWSRSVVSNSIYIWIYIKSLNHFAIHLKLTQSCEPTILQFHKIIQNVVWTIYLYNSVNGS